jgi:hypothetical protein
MIGSYESADGMGMGERVGAKDLNVALVVLPDGEAGSEEGDQLVRRLRAELSELDVQSISMAAAGTVPAGSKAGDPVTLGAIVVALSASGGIVSALIETVRDWLGRQQRRHRVSVTIDGDTIELERASAGERRDLVEAYVRRHSAP